MTSHPNPRLTIPSFLEATLPPDDPCFDPLLIAARVLRVDNMVMDRELAARLQVMYEDIANRYLDISALLQSYVDKCSRDEEL